MKKILLSAAAFSFLTAGNAQALLNYGFEEPLTAPMTLVGENWNNEVHGSVFPNSTFNAESTEAPHTGAKALYAHVDPLDCGEEGTEECGSWQRVVALTNTGFGENKSYRVTLWTKGSGKINVALLKGCFDHDKAPYDKSYDFTLNGEYTKQSFIFWSPSREVMTAQQADFAQDEYWNQDFLRLSFRAAGEYYVDDITIDESVLSSLTYNNQVVAVSYAYPTNIAAIADGKATPLTGAEVSVKADGEEKTVKAVEVHADGKLYIFLDEDSSLPSGANVEVTISNAGGIEFTQGVEPYNFTADVCPATTFAGEVASYDENLTETAFADAEPVLLSAWPSDGSFEIDPTTKEFSFTFDHTITVDDEDYAAKAYLNGEPLVLKTAENSKTVVFERTSTEDLARGTHTLKIENVATDVAEGNGMWNERKFANVSFEVGEIKLAETVYTDLFSVWMEGEYNTAQPTNGWISYFNGAENTTNANRVGNMITQDMGVGFYFCQRDATVAAQLTYGEKEESPLTLPAADNLQLCLYHTLWQSKGGNIKYSLIKKAENLVDTVATGSAIAVDNTGNFGETVTGVTPVSIKLPAIEAGNYILSLETSAGWDGTIVYGFKVRSYVETEGDKYESTIYLEDKTFGDAEDNCAPKAGSGWALYQDGTKRDAGANYNYDGTRIFKLGVKNLSVGYYTNGNWNNGSSHYIIYGEGGEYGEGAQEPVLTLPEGRLQFTYYAANWKTNERILYFQLLDENGEIVAERADKIVMNPHMDGNRNASVETNKIQFNQTIPVAGNYKIKFGGDGEMFIGNITIEKPGSNAALYHQKLNNYIADAKAELELSADVKYDGTTKNTLLAAVEKYSAVPNGMHTPEEYDAACEELENLTKALATRRATITKYDQVKVDISNYLNGETAIDEKYNALDCYKTLTETYATYENITAQQLEDEELISATNTLEVAYNSTKHMVDVGVPALTAQITALTTQLIELDETQTESELVLAAGNAISDDQVIATSLKLQVLKALYTKIATDAKFFVETDEDTGTETPKAYDVTSFIQNPKVYTNAPAHDNCKISNYPGWESDKPDFAMRPNYGWGGWDTNPYYLIHANDMFIGIGWVGDDGVTVSNNVEYLPVGTFNLTIATMDRSGAGDWKDGANTWPNPEYQTSYIFYQQGEEEPVTQAFKVDDLGQYYGFTDDVMTDIALTGEVYANVKVGAYIHAQGSFAAIRNVRLEMTAKADFDYAAAAEALQEIINGIEVVAREDAPVAARYYNLNGQEINEAEGVCIKIETYADGYMVVKKIVK